MRSTKHANVTQAARAFLKTLGYEPQGELAKTPERVATLWLNHLLAGANADLAAIVGRGIKTTQSDSVSVLDINVHLVCPHHLTVAFGVVHIGYVPNGKLCGFGTLTELATACTSQLILQEDATLAIADALVTHLGAKAAVVGINATHPCHNVPHRNAHRARAITWAKRGHAKTARELQSSMQAELITKHQAT